MVDTATRLSMLQERFKSGTQKIYIESLNDALETITGKLEKLDSLTEIKRQVALKKLLEQEIGQLYGKLIEPIQEDMQGFAEISHESIFDALNGETGLGYAFAGLPKGTMKKIISMDEINLVGDKAYSLKDLFDGAKTAQVNRYKQIIAGGLAGNEGYRAIVKRLKQANAKATTDMFSIVHTAVSSARDKADAEAYKDFDDVITGWKSIAVLDSRTSLHCASLDGRMYYKKQGYPSYDKIPNRPPRHFRCRSRLIPKTDFKTDITRPQNGDEKGQVSNKTKFNEWFGNQSDDFQRNYLGKGRYDLYKSGKLEIKDFVDIKNGEIFTIQEIREKFLNKPTTAPKPKPKQVVEKPKKPAKKVEYVPVKNYTEAEQRVKALGIPNVTLKGMKANLLNVVVKTLEAEHRKSPLTLNKVEAFSKKSNGALGMYSPSNKSLHINKSFLKDKEFSVEKVLPYKEQLKEVDDRVKKWTENYLDNPLYDQRRVKRTIRAFKSKVSDLESKIQKGETPLQWTVGSVRDSLEKQLEATVIHETGHHRHYVHYDARQNFVFDKARSVSTYGKVNHKEYYAEWYTHYRLHGGKDVPSDILALFKEVDND